MRRGYRQRVYPDPKSRWYAQTLATRIRNIQRFREKITFIQGDGIAIIEKFASQKTAAFFIDPPYTAGKNGKRAGKRLYTHNELDHEELFRQSEKIKGELLMTYDNAEEVIQMAARHGFSTRLISMMNTHHATMQELIIGHNLEWAQP
jgi:DNA adenine methylase